MKVERKPDNYAFDSKFGGVVEKVAVVRVNFNVFARFVFRFPAVKLHEAGPGRERDVPVMVAVERAVLVVRTDIGDRDDIDEVRIASAQEHAALVAYAHDRDAHAPTVGLRKAVIERAEPRGRHGGRQRSSCEKITSRATARSRFFLFVTIHWYISYILRAGRGVDG